MGVYRAGKSAYNYSRRIVIMTKKQEDKNDRRKVFRSVGYGVARRNDRRSWVAMVGVFAMVFVFAFLMAKYKDNNVADAANLGAFDAGYIMSDYQMGNYNSMSEADIQNFLKQKGNCNDTRTYLADYYTSYSYHIRDGHFVCLADETFGDGTAYGNSAPNGASAAHIIWQAAQDYRINPQVIIVLLQKEQGLITDSWPNNRQYRSATGYGCPDTAACDAQYYGFKNQVRKAAALFRTVLDGGWTNYPLGWNYVQYNPDVDCGGSWVNIRSLATSALYRYTPYQPNSAALAAGYGTGDSCSAYGNRNFYSYFEDWFGGITSDGVILAPRNIRAVQNDNTIKVSWDAPSNVDLFGDVKYEVVIADEDRKEIKVTVGGDKREYTFNNLSEGTYIATSVKVVAKNSSDFGRITFDYSVGRLPSAPTNLKVMLYNGGVKVSWSRPGDTGGLRVLKYEVVLADVDRKEYKLDVDGGQSSVIFYGLPFNRFFAASVKTINAKGGQHARITFDIKNYADFSNDFEIYDSFLDMPSDETSKKAVSWAVYNGITDKNQYFNGENALTRRQAMVLLWRVAGKPDVNTYNGFSDMPSDEISKKAVSWAVYNGITDRNQYFNGEGALTRRQAMALLWRFCGKIVEK